MGCDGGSYSGEKKTYGCWAGFDEKSGLGEPLLAREYVRHCLCCFLPVQVFKDNEAFAWPPDTLRERTGSSCRVLNDCW